MNNLLIIYETYTNGYKTDILDIISLLAILCSILVIACLRLVPIIFSYYILEFILNFNKNYTKLKKKP